MDRLVKTRFTLELLPDIQGFDCGDLPHEREVSDWIKGIGPDNVLDALARDTDVWLYGTEQDGLVGFGSLCRALWSYPKPNRRRDIPISLIPMVGVDQRFRGAPSDAEPEDRYSSRILLDLIGEARRCPPEERRALLGLFVDPANVRAVAFYKRLGFMDHAQKFQHYRGMILKLDIGP